MALTTGHTRAQTARVGRLSNSSVPLGSLTPRLLKQWLVQQIPETQVGVARDSGGCPIASFLTTLGAEQPQVTLEFITFDFRGTSLCFPSPRWVAAFVRKVDAEAQYGTWLVTPSRALQVLREVMATPEAA